MYVYRDLIDASTGKVNRAALKTMVRRRIAGERIDGYAGDLHTAIDHYRTAYNALLYGWRVERGLPVPDIHIPGFKPVGLAWEA